MWPPYFDCWADGELRRSTTISYRCDDFLEEKGVSRCLNNSSNTSTTRGVAERRCFPDSGNAITGHSDNGGRKEAAARPGPDGPEYKAFRSKHSCTATSGLAFCFPLRIADPNDYDHRLLDKKTCPILDMRFGLHRR